MKAALGRVPIELTKARICFVLLGLALVTYGGFDYVQQSTAVEDAVTVEATIEEAAVSEPTGRDSQYHVHVEFSYRYRGTEYVGEDLFPGSIGESYDTRDAARSALEPYPEGETVTAYVDPDAPDEGFLERRTTSGPVVAVAFGAVLVVLTTLDAAGAQTPGQGTELGPASERDRPYRTLLGVDRDVVNRISKRGIKVTLAAVVASLVGVVLILLVLGAGSDGTPQRAVGFTDPLGFLLGVAFLAALGLITSLLLYGVWSYTEYRRLRERIPEPRPPSPFTRPTRLVTILLANDALDDYGRRVKLTGTAFVIGLFFVGVLLEILVF